MDKQQLIEKFEKKLEEVEKTKLRPKEKNQLKLRFQRILKRLKGEK